MKKSGSKIWIVVVMTILLAPSAGRLFTAQESEENETAAVRPQLMTEEGMLNVSFLSQLGTYFQQHFAFRDIMISANAELMQTFFRESSDDGVIVGSEGWLYYADSLSDYLGTHLMSDRQLQNLARSLSMLDTCLEEHGIRLLYVPVPNKNTLYDEYMPYYDRVRVSEDHNLFRLYEQLEKENVPYLNLYRTFSENPQILYHRTDSHWTNSGAALASMQILQALGKETPDYTKEAYTVQTDFVGDLEKMLYPSHPKPEEEIYFDRGHSFIYTTEVESNYDPYIHTENPDASGSAVIYRDSFGNALLPFLADGFSHAFFSRGGVYSLQDAEKNQADTVIIERAERLLWTSLGFPFLIPAVEADLSEMDETQGEIVDSYTIRETAADTPETDTYPSLIKNGRYLQLKGYLPETPMNTDCYLYAKFPDGRVYEALPCSFLGENGWEEYGYCVNLDERVCAGQELRVTIYAMDHRLDKKTDLHETIAG